MKKIAVIFGTRPEFLKLYPVIKKLWGKCEFITISTGQHAELLDSIMNEFYFNPTFHYEMTHSDLTNLSLELHKIIGDQLSHCSPDLVIVQGDTSTALYGAIEAYYRKIPVAHVEAGLRTYDNYNPFPEEVDRKIIAQIATYHFAPTAGAADNLRMENIRKNVFITGNTIVDMVSQIEKTINVKKKNQVLVTLHRRESFGKDIRHIMEGIKDFNNNYPSWDIVFPVHPNSNVGEAVKETLVNIKNIHLLSPQPYKEMIRLMKESKFIVTDSGGIVEEAPTVNTPVLIAREKTERPEAIKLGVAELIGVSRDAVALSMSLMVSNPDMYNLMLNKKNPYGDGHAGERIAKCVLQ